MFLTHTHTHTHTHKGLIEIFRSISALKHAYSEGKDTMIS